MMSSALVWVVLVGVGAAATLGGGGDEACRGTSGAAWVAAKGDCSKFFLCVDGKAHDYSCGANVWDQQTKTCVEKGSRFDSCTSSSGGGGGSDLEGSLENLGKPCANGEEFSPEKDNCAQYYDCSANSPIFRGADPRLRECKYPFLWSLATQRCEYYTDVECQSRFEPVDPCEYRRNLCHAAHCIPCNVRNASCRDKPDGLNPWQGKESSPFYAVCSNNHVVYTGFCLQKNGTWLFDPDVRTCVMVSNGGNM